jgi:predicted metalloprotease with PDZ domain
MARTRLHRNLCSLTAAVFLLCAVAGGLAASPIRYTVWIKDTASHRVHVSVNLPPGAEERDLQLPVWNATYQIRDFSQYINWIHAFSPAGAPLPLHAVNKSLWRISNAADGAVIHYEFYADDPGPFGAELNPQHAFFNLAELLIYPVDARSSPVAVKFIDLPPGWNIAVALPPAGAQEFTAENYDRLVDAPAEIGPFKEAGFDQDGGHYRVVVDADPSDYDMNRIVSVLRPMVAAETWWMNDRPFQTYLFIYHFPRHPTGGGMEHANSTAINLSANTLAQRPELFNQVTAHEFFHLWNVKRIRPQSMEPVDYTRENYTRALWFSEGVTSTVCNYALLRANLQNEQAFLKEFADQIQELETRSAHLTQSAEQSSLDAWLERYTYYNLPERSISYYNKGELLGFALDLAVRDASEGKASLRDLFWWLNQHYAKEGRFFPDSEGVQIAAEAITHKDFRGFFAKYVQGVDEIPWNTFLASSGLQLMQREAEFGDPEFTAIPNASRSMQVNWVSESGQAFRAGARTGDVVLTLNGREVRSRLPRELNDMAPNQEIHLRVRSENGSERDLSWRLAAAKRTVYEIIDVANVTAAQKARRAAWLAGESQAGEP